MDLDPTPTLSPRSPGALALWAASALTLAACALQAITLFGMGSLLIFSGIQDGNLEAGLGVTAGMGVCWGLPALVSFVVGCMQALVARTLRQTGVTPLVWATLVAGILVPVVRLPLSYLSMNCLDFFVQGVVMSGGVVAAVLVFYDRH